MAFKLNATFFLSNLTLTYLLNPYRKAHEQTNQMGHHYINRSRLGRTRHLSIYPSRNEELTAADALPKENKQRTLKVNAQVIKPHLLTDEILVTGRLVPDEEVSLSFETSGKITDIFSQKAHW